MITKESAAEVNEIIRLCKRDRRYEWCMKYMIKSMRRERKIIKKVMSQKGYDESRTAGIIEEYNSNVLLFCKHAKLEAQKYRHEEIKKWTGKKLNYFTHKNGKINESAMIELYRWADDNRIAKKIFEVENYSVGRILKYARKSAKGEKQWDIQPGK